MAVKKQEIGSAPTCAPQDYIAVRVGGIDKHNTWDYDSPKIW